MHTPVVVSPNVAPFVVKHGGGTRFGHLAQFVELWSYVAGRYRSSRMMTRGSSPANRRICSPAGWSRTSARRSTWPSLARIGSQAKSGYSIPLAQISIPDFDWLGNNKRQYPSGYCLLALLKGRCCIPNNPIGCPVAPSRPSRRIRASLLPQTLPSPSELGR